MAILTKKTLVLKKAEADLPAAETLAEGEQAPDSLPMASVRGTPPMAEAVSGPPVSYTVAAICALLAVIFLLALLGVQWMEDSSYSNAIPRVAGR